MPTALLPTDRAAMSILHKARPREKADVYWHGNQQRHDGITLHADIHAGFEAHDQFFIFPALGGPSAQSTMHMVADDMDYYAELVHRRPVAFHEWVSVEFLYAWFACAVVNCTPRTLPDELKHVEPNAMVKKLQAANKSKAVWRGKKRKRCSLLPC
jgi:hypothetical protein